MEIFWHAPVFVRSLFEVDGDMRSRQILWSERARTLEILAISETKMFLFTERILGFVEADLERGSIKQLFTPK